MRKASGQKRAVLDLRAINDKLEPHLVELPNMTQLLHSIASQKGQFHTSLDLANGFFFAFHLRLAYHATSHLFVTQFPASVIDIQWPHSD